jgi:hypothetical protein
MAGPSRFGEAFSDGEIAIRDQDIVTAATDAERPAGASIKGHGRHDEVVHPIVAAARRDSAVAIRPTTKAPTNLMVAMRIAWRLRVWPINRGVASISAIVYVVNNR